MRPSRAVCAQFAEGRTYESFCSAGLRSRRKYRSKRPVDLGTCARVGGREVGGLGVFFVGETCRADLIFAKSA